MPAWQDYFKQHSIAVGFRLLLTRGMCEFLSAVADGVEWDRAKYGGALAYPDNWLATSAALVKRGMIERKPEAARGAGKPSYIQTVPDDDRESYRFSYWNLTPAGASVVELLKIAGLFVEADAAIEKKAKAPKGRNAG